MTSSCPMCSQVEKARSGHHPRLVREFDHSYLVVGDHQLFPGYCVLITKKHAREPFELEPAEQEGLFRELMLSARAIQDTYRPWKINYACYGNQVPHIHWHLFPRYENDPLKLQPVWVQSAEFGKHATTTESASELAARVRVSLEKLGVK